MVLFNHFAHESQIKYKTGYIEKKYSVKKYHKIFTTFTIAHAEISEIDGDYYAEVGAVGSTVAQSHSSVSFQGRVSVLVDDEVVSTYTLRDNLSLQTENFISAGNVRFQLPQNTYGANVSL